jgi:hypothetical protein
VLGMAVAEGVAPGPERTRLVISLEGPGVPFSTVTVRWVPSDAAALESEEGECPACGAQIPITSATVAARCPRCAAAVCVVEVGQAS